MRTAMQSETGKELNAWILLDASGMTQKVTQQDVKILLGNKSVESVLAASLAHPIPRTSNNLSKCAVEDDLEWVIQGSVPLLYQNEASGEKTKPHEWKTDERTETMLMYISQSQVEDVPNSERELFVRFITLDADRVHNWKCSHELNRFEVNTDASTSKQNPVIVPETFLCETFPDASSSTTNPTKKHQPESCDLGRVFIPNKNVDRFQYVLPQTAAHSDVRSLPEDWELTRNDKLHLKIDNHVGKCKDLCDRSERMLPEEQYRASLLHLDSRKARDKNNKVINAERDESLLREWNKLKHNLVSEHALKTLSCPEPAQTFKELKRDIEGLKMHIFHSEYIIKQSIAKYISDKTLEKQLLNAVECYSRNKMESEYNLKNLSQEVLEEQINVLKSQQHILDANIISLQKKNLDLDVENTALLKKMEKLELRLTKQQSVEADASCERSLINEESCFIQNNKKLRAKLSSAQSQVEAMEEKLQEAQFSAETFASQLQRLKSEVENYKLAKNRMETDHEIECRSIKEELGAKNRLLRESMDAANVLVDDMNSLKKQLKESAQNIQINWNSLLVQPVGRNSLTDLVHMYRGCLSELGRELIKTQNQLQSANKDIQTLRREAVQMKQVVDETIEANSKLKKRLETAEAERAESLGLIQHLSDEHAQLQEHFQVSVHSQLKLQDEIMELNRIKEAEIQQDILGEKVEKVIQKSLATNVNEELELEIKKLSVENQHLLQNLYNAEISFQELQLKIDPEESKKNHEEVIKELQHMNTALKMEIDSLCKCKLPTTCDVHHVDNLMKAEMELFKETTEKTCLWDQLQTVKGELAAQAEVQCSYITHIQLTQSGMDLLMQENAALKAECENYKCVITNLEQNNLNMIGQHNAASVNSDNQIKTIQAALVEEQNIGKELNKIIDEKSKTMNTLEKSLVKKDTLVDQLEGQLVQLHETSELDRKHAEEQFKSTIDAVCELTCDAMKAELTIVQRELKDLQIKLCGKDRQLQQFVELKRELELCCATDMEETALLKETTQNDLNRKQDSIDRLTTETTARAVKIAQLEQQLSHAQEYIKRVDELHKEVKIAADKFYKYEHHIAEMDRGFEQYVLKSKRELEEANREKCTLNQTIYHLQSVIDSQKISLDKAHQHISSLQQMGNNLQHRLDEHSKRQIEVASALNQHNELVSKLQYLQDQLTQAAVQYGALNDEYLQFKDAVSRREEELACTMGKQTARANEYEQGLNSLQEEKIDLLQALDVVQEENNAMKERNNYLEQLASAQCKALGGVCMENGNNEDFGIEDAMCGSHDSQQTQYPDHYQVGFEVHHVHKQLQDVNKQLENSLMSLEEERLHSKLLINQVTSNHSEQKKCLLKEMKTLGLRNQFVEQLVSEKEKTIKQLDKEHKDLSEKLLGAIRMVFDEKIQRLSLEVKSQGLVALIKQLKTEKTKENSAIKEMIALEVSVCVKEETIRSYKRKTAFLEGRIEELKAEINNLRNKLLQQSQEQGELEKSIIELQSDKRTLVLQLKILNGIDKEEKSLHQLLLKASSKYLEVPSSSDTCQPKRKVKQFMANSSSRTEVVTNTVCMKTNYKNEQQEQINQTNESSRKVTAQIAQ